MLTIEQMFHSFLCPIEISVCSVQLSSGLLKGRKPIAYLISSSKGEEHFSSSQWNLCSGLSHFASLSVSLSRWYRLLLILATFLTPCMFWVYAYECTYFNNFLCFWWKVFSSVSYSWKLEVMVHYLLHVNFTDNFCSCMVGLLLSPLLFGIYFYQAQITQLKSYRSKFLSWRCEFVGFYLTFYSM